MARRAFCVVVAEIRSGEIDELRAASAARGLEGRLEFLGWADDAEYHQRVGEATLAPQLRAFSQGEMSASVADCLAGGLPTIVNDCGPCAELPDDTALRLRRHPAPREGADAVASLLDDADRRAGLSAAALDHVEAHGADRAAGALLELITDGEPLAGTAWT